MKLAIASGIFALFVLAGIFLGTTLHWDEGAFFQNAEAFLGDVTNTEPSRPMAWSYTIAQIWRFTGESVIAARLFTFLFGLATIYLLYKIASREFINPGLPAAALALMPLLIMWSVYAYTDVPSLAFILLAIYGYKKENHVLAGVGMGLATALRYISGLFVIGLLLAYLLERKAKKIPHFAVGTLIGLIPMFVYSFLTYGDPIYHMLFYMRDVSAMTPPGFLAKTFDNLMFGVLILSGLLPGVYSGWRKTPVVEKVVLVPYVLFIVLVTGTAFARYWLPAIPVAILIAYRGLTRRDFVFAVAATVAISGLLVAGGYRADTECFAPFEDAMEYMQDKEGAVVTDSYAMAGFLLDRPSYPPGNLEELRVQENVTYAVMRGEPLPYHSEKTFSNWCSTWQVYDLSRPTDRPV